MSKLIIENNMNGRLWVENTKEGALFKIITPKTKNNLVIFTTF